MITLYADLLQSRQLSDVYPGSISTKTVRGKKYLYSVEKYGMAREQRFLGPADDADAQAEAANVKRAQAQARGMRSTVSALKKARLPSPSLPMGRVLEAVSGAGLFDLGLTLVGTAAYQIYAPVLGYYLSSAALLTNDVDLSVAEFTQNDEVDDIDTILRRADSTFEPKWRADDKLPMVFQSSNGLTVDMLTCFGRGRKTPVEIAPLNCAAEALSFQEYLTEDTIEAIALYGRGVLVRVPAPEKFAIHKLLVAHRRPQSQNAKKRKDLLQAGELMDILIQIDEVSLLDNLDDAREKGRTWKTSINASLKEIGREARQGHLPLLTRPI